MADPPEVWSHLTGSWIQGAEDIELPALLNGQDSTAKDGRLFHRQDVPDTVRAVKFHRVSGQELLMPKLAIYNIELDTQYVRILKYCWVSVRILNSFRSTFCWATLHPECDRQFADNIRKIHS